MMDIAELLFGGAPAKAVEAPKWLKGMRLCPILRGDELWWECPPIMMVRGGLPSGVSYSHVDPHVLPADFGPAGRPTQVMQTEKDVYGIVALRDQLGEVRARCFHRHLRLAERLSGDGLRWFVYPTPDPDRDNRAPIVGFVHERRPSDGWNGAGEPTLAEHFTPFAIISQVTVSMGNFVSQEALEAMPPFSGTRTSEGGGDDGHE